MVVIDILGSPQTRIVNLYRPFNPKQMPELTFFCNQVSKLDELIINNTIIPGDFNLDLNKEHLLGIIHKEKLPCNDHVAPVLWGSEMVIL